jgi:hypothetical protein
MQSPGLTRRRGRLELLARACERGECAQIRPAAAAADTRAEHAALLLLERDGLILSWAGEGRAAPAHSGTPLDVRFAVDGQQYCFRSFARGVVDRAIAGRGAVRGLKLALPLRIDPARSRCTTRFGLRPGDLPPAALTPLMDRERRLSVRIVELSAQRLRVHAAAALRELLIPGVHYCVELPLPGRGRNAELIIRLTHVGGPTAELDGALSASFLICAGDDGSRVADVLERVADCLGAPGEVGTDARGGAALEGATC